MPTNNTSPHTSVASKCFKLIALNFISNLPP
jgi:hypothetical protein